MTDNVTSLSEGNQTKIANWAKKDEYPRGFQQASPKIIYLAVPPVDGKSPLNVLLHEIAHNKWTGLGQSEPHDPLFYKLLNDCLKKMGIQPDPLLDLDGQSIDGIPSPYGKANPLLYYHYQKKSDLIDDFDKTGSSSSHWTTAQPDNQHTNFYLYDKNGNLVLRENYTFSANRLQTAKYTDMKSGAYQLASFDANDTQSFKHKIKYYTKDNDLVKEDIIYADGSYDANTYDPLEVSTISSKNAHYDSNGVVISSVTHYDTNSRTYVLNDASDKSDWSSVSEYFDKDGHKWQRIILADDGTKKVETFSSESTHGYTEPNDPTVVKYYDSGGTLLRTSSMTYGVLYQTDKKVLAHVQTFDTANKYSWDNVTYYYNSQGKLLDTYKDMDQGLGYHAVPNDYFSSKWDFASLVDSNQLFHEFSPFSYYSSENSSNLDLPDLNEYNPIDQYTHDYTGYKGIDFGSAATTNPYSNIFLYMNDNTLYQDFTYAANTLGPIVLDLNGDGVTVSALGHSKVKLKTTTDGIPHEIAWVGADDGLLVFDPSSNSDRMPDGIISDVKEISFSALLESKTGEKLSDLAAAAILFDDNDDGILSDLDSDFGHLQIWRDINGDGVSQSGELSKLSAFNIKSINLHASSSNIYLLDGSCVRGLSTYTTEGGRTLAVGDVEFAYAGPLGTPETSVSHVTLNLRSDGLLDVVNHRVDDMVI